MDTSNTLSRLIMVGIPYPSLDSATRSLLQGLRPGGILLFRRNYTDVETLVALCDELHALFPDSPLLIAVDHEGGRVHRLSPPFTHFPPAASLGKNRSPDLARRVGRAMGRELRAVGIDINFAPVLDTLIHPENTVIGDRAFSADPEMVSHLGCAFARGLREGGVLPCGKHFPGHGATLVDSHEDLPQDERSADIFAQVDLAPFRQALAEQIEMMMTAHVLYPAFDPDLPATLSPTIVTRLLRHTLGFQGVVVTDDLEMGAIVRHATVEHAAVEALRAGADFLLICHSLERAFAVRDACLHALRTGTLSPRRVQDAGQRIDMLKRQHRQQQPAWFQSIGAPEHQRLVEEIARQGS